MALALVCLLVCGQRSWAQTDVTTEAELTSVGTNGGDAKLQKDITLTTTLLIPTGKEVTIDLNGHTLNRGLTSVGGNTGHVIEVSMSATLTISDSGTRGSITGGFSDYGGAIYNRGTVTITGGTFTGNHATVGGGAICNRGTMTITGGTISGNESADGGGIWTDSANSALYMAGNPVVRDNSGGDLFLNNSARINVTGAFTSGAHICVSELARTFTKDYATYNSVSPDNYFFMPSNLSGTVGLDGGEVRFSVATYDFLSRSWDEANKVVTTSTETCSDFTVLDKNSSRLSNGWYVVNNSLSFSNRVVVQGDNVNIILCDNKKLTAPQGIKVNSNAKLNIYAQSDGDGMGKLVARTSANDHAAIGGEKNDLAGTVRIHGGNIDAQAGYKYGAGIGGGYGDGSGMREITIYGGMITAKSQNNAAGIGAAKHNNTVGTINIYGGTVTATGAKMAAGIGGAEDRGGWNTNIYGGTVTATGGYKGAGIGGGYDGGGGNINIYGGTVTATGGYSAAGIGGGGSDEVIASNYYNDGGTITIYDGTVIAKSGERGAGIGGGWLGSGGGHITIHGGTVTATGFKGRGAGIGGGEAQVSGKGGDGGIITINGGTITANGSTGIGGGYIAGGGKITINGGEITATSDAGVGGAGIGGAAYGGGGTIVILGGTVTAKGSGREGGPANFLETENYQLTAAAIGAGMSGKSGSVTIGNNATVDLYLADDLKNVDRQLFRDRYPIVRSDVDEEPGTLILGDALKVTRWNGAFNGGIYDWNATPLGSVEADGRVYVSLNKECSHMLIAPCDHDDIDYTYVSENLHKAQCKNCKSYLQDEDHEIVSTTHLCSKCGYGDEVTVHSLAFYRLSTATKEYEGTDYPAVDGQEITLPECTEVPEGFIFAGWSIMSDVPANRQMTDNETLYYPGDNYVAEGNVSFYARYRYTFKESWQWGPDYSWATLYPYGPYLQSAEGSVSHKHVDATVESPGSDIYTATAQYVNDGCTYTFTDTRVVPSYWVYELGEDDNTDLLATYEGNTGDVQLTGRTLYRDGSWNTLCLPFDIEVEGSPLAGATVKSFESADYLPSTQTLVLNFEDATVINAGRPYLIRWESAGGENAEGNLEFPTFSGVTLYGEADDDEYVVSDDIIVTFRGTYVKQTYEDADHSILYLGSDNMLYYPAPAEDGQPVTIGAQRAFFQLAGLTAGDLSSEARLFVLNFGDGDSATGIISLYKESVSRGAAASGWYDLQGRRLSGKPAKKGIYINDGKKIIVK